MAQENPQGNDLPVKPEKNRLIDFVFVIDVSDSMRPCIDNLVMNLNPLVAEIEKGEGMSSAGQKVPVDWRMGIVAHNSLHDYKTTLSALDITGENLPTSVDRVREVLGQCGSMLANSEASLHALDWAVDNISWRHPEGGYRRFLVLFTDEPVHGGDMAGVTKESFEKLLLKLYNFNLFLVAPIDRDEAGQDVSWKLFKDHPQLKGFQHVEGSDPAHWAAIDWKKLTEKIGKTMTQVAAPEGAAAPAPNVFGMTFPPAVVNRL